MPVLGPPPPAHCVYVCARVISVCIKYRPTMNGYCGRDSLGPVTPSSPGVGGGYSHLIFPAIFQIPHSRSGVSLQVLLEPFALTDLRAPLSGVVCQIRIARIRRFFPRFQVAWRAGAFMRRFPSQHQIVSFTEHLGNVAP